MFKASVLSLDQPEGTVLFDLNAFSAGPHAVLDRIAEGQSGIYAWFRSFHFRPAPSEFAEDLIEAIRAPKFQTRAGDIAPYYEVSLKSKSNISRSKEESLKVALKDDGFLSAMKFALQWSILFQAPLYVGKSTNLRGRVEQHLKSGSVLRERLLGAGIDIDKTYLLVVPTPTPMGNMQIESETELDSEDEPVSEYELLFEEVFSRLFNPAFTIRLG
jgi:hypothetical protein